MKSLIKIADRLIKNFLGVIASAIVIKSNKRYIVGGWFGKSFSDNTKYLYSYLSRNKEKYNIEKITWVTNNIDVYEELKLKGLDVEMKNSLKGIWIQLRAKYHIIDQSYDNINPYTSYFANRVQLWHGVGFKKLSDEYAIPKFDTKYKIKKAFKCIKIPGAWNKYIFLSTSKFATENIFKFSFRLWENKIIENNYPRNIFLNDKSVFDKNIVLNKKHIELINIINRVKENGNKIILYMPTYRGEANVSNKKEIKYNFNLNKEELYEFNQYLIRKKYIILDKEHLAGEKNSEMDFERIINLNSDLDIYPILEYVDCLITDYSSIYADFLFINKPIIFYAYDLEYYENKDKGLLFNYYDVTPGDKAFNIDELKEKIANNMKEDIYVSKRKEILDMYFGESVNTKMSDLVRKIIDISKN